MSNLCCGQHKKPKTLILIFGGSSNSPSAYHFIVQLRYLRKILPSRKVARDFQIETQLVVDPAGFWLTQGKTATPS